MANLADIINLQIKLSNKQLYIYNVYNPINSKKDNTKISILKQKLVKNLYKKHIIFYTFNLYHKLWKRPDVSKIHIKKSEKLPINMQK